MRKHLGGGKCVLCRGRVAGHHAAHVQLPLPPQELPNATVVTVGMSWKPEQRVWGPGSCLHNRERNGDLMAAIQVSNT